MKRYLLALLLIPIVFTILGVTIEARGSGAQQSTKKSGKKMAIECPDAVTASDGTITDCPNTGCGGSLDLP